MAYPAIRSDLGALVRSDFIRLITRGLSFSDCLLALLRAPRTSDFGLPSGESLLGAAGLRIFGFGIGVPCFDRRRPSRTPDLGISDLLDSVCGLGLRILGFRISTNSANTKAKRARAQKGTCLRRRTAVGARCARLNNKEEAEISPIELRL